MLHLLDHIEVSPTCKKPLTCLDELTAAKLIIRGAVDWCRVVVISFRVTFRFIVVFYIWVSQNENIIICSEQRYFDLKGTRNPEFCVPKSSDWTQWSKKNPSISLNGTKWVTRSSPPARYGRHRLPSSTCKQNRGLKRLAIQLHSKCEDSPCNHGGMMLVSPLCVYIKKISPKSFWVILWGFPIHGILQKLRSQNTTGVIPAYWFQGRNQGLSDYHNLYKRW